MIETLTIIIAVLAIAALIILVHGLKDPKPVSQPQPRAAANLSPLERRKEALELANQRWLYSVEHGLTHAGKREKEVMETLEREVADLENERFGAAGEYPSPAPETPKRQSEIKVDFINGVLSGDYYLTTCSFCGWSATSSSMYTASARRDKHEREHA